MLISGTRIKRSELSDIILDSVGLVGELVSESGTSAGSETVENIGIVVKLIAKLIDNTAFNAQHSKETFSLNKQFVYGLIYTVQNKQNMLKEPGVIQTNMKRSEFLDAKHIRLVFLSVSKQVA